MTKAELAFALDFAKEAFGIDQLKERLGMCCCVCKCECDTGGPGGPGGGEGDCGCG